MSLTLRLQGFHDAISKAVKTLLFWAAFFYPFQAGKGVIKGQILAFISRIRRIVI
jgi:hypothetical protein